MNAAHRTVPARPGVVASQRSRSLTVRQDSPPVRAAIVDAELARGRGAIAREAAYGAEAAARPDGARLAATLAAAQARWRPWAAFAAVVGLALALNTWSLSSAGYGNTYYAAATRSMTLSWKNFFFGAYDPGGFITVDKPPVFLWVDALSARAFGYSSWSLLLPSAVAGAASVGLLWLIARAHFGVFAATVAGVALALTPVSVAVDRLNLPEPFMILALVGAAGAALRSLESRRWWAWLALAGALVGVGFNTKMLAAWIPGPAFALTVIAGTRVISRASLRSLALRLGVLGLATLVVSGSWLVVVDAWPASARPYIGGSRDNTVLDLAIGYNGFGRVDGDGQGAPGGAARANRPAPPASTRRGGFAGPGGIFGGLPGWLRMFDDANGGQIGWLLPFAALGGALALWSGRREPERRAFAVMFLGWLLLYAGVFSYARGIFHSYYTSAMAPAAAALCGAGAASARRLILRDRRWLIALAATALVTLCVQLAIAGRTPDFYGWMRPFAVLATAGGLALAAALALRRRPATAGIALSLGGLLLVPGAWSVSAAANASLNTTLPQAGPQRGASGATFGSQAFDAGAEQLAPWLAAHATAGATWQLVVPNSQDASRLIAEHDISVMSLGGFLGNDDTISVAGFADLVAQGKVRYVLATARGFGPGGGGPRGNFAPNRGFGGGGVPGLAPNGNLAPGGIAPNFGTPRGRGGGFGFAPTASASGPQAVLAAVRAACAPVEDRTLPAQYQGALYDCAGRAGTLAARAP